MFIFDRIMYVCSMYYSIRVFLGSELLTTITTTPFVLYSEMNIHEDFEEYELKKKMSQGSLVVK